MYEYQHCRKILFKSINESLFNILSKFIDES